MTIIGGGIRVEYTLNTPARVKRGRPESAHIMRRIIDMFFKANKKQKLEASFDASTKEECCCYLCERYRQLN